MLSSALAHDRRSNQVNGTSRQRYSFAATRLKFPTTSRAISGSNTFCCGQFVFGSPDYDIRNPRFFMPGFISPSSAAETNTPNTIQIEGLSVKIGTTWYTVPSRNLPFTIDPSTMPGVLLDPIDVVIPANTLVTARVAYNVPSSGQLPCVGKNTTGGLEASQGSTSTLSARLTDGTSLTNTNVHSDLYAPSYMVAQGGDGRPACILVGNSIGQGVNEISVISLWNARNEVGFLARGLDDNSTAKRLAYANLCIPGDRPTGTAGWDTRSNWAGKLDAVKQVFTAYGCWPFDMVISEHGTNSIPTGTYASGLKPGMVNYFSLMKNEWGKPIVQMELLPKPTSTDGFATLVNQTPTAGNDDYPSGQRWQLNADIGSDGIADPTKYFRVNGYIDDSFAPWLQTAYDLSSNRDKLAIRPYNSTLAASYSSGGSISLNAAPNVGETLIFVQSGSVKFDALVSAVSGSGPYTVTFTNLSTTSALNSGDVVQASYHDKAGLHPSTIAHRDYYAQEVIAWKKRRGFGLGV